MWYNEENKDDILRSDYLDILYQGHNKNYGGYELRKHYSKRMATAFAVLLGFGTLAGGYGLLFAGGTKEVPIMSRSYHLSDFHNTVCPTHNVTPPPAKLKRRVATQDTRPPEVTDDNKVEDKDLPGENKVVTNAGAENHTGDTTPLPIGAGSGNDTVADAPAGPPPVQEIRPYAEVMPTPTFDITEFLSRNLHYPERAREINIQGRVVVQFVVNEDGSISNVIALRGIGAGCDDEAVRVISAMPAWKPGSQNGFPVRILYTLPIMFKLE